MSLTTTPAGFSLLIFFLVLFLLSAFFFNQLIDGDKANKVCDGEGTPSFFVDVVEGDGLNRCD